MRKTNTKRLTALAMMSAMAYLVVFICHFIMPPIVSTPALKLDFKDMVIVMSGFMYGPTSAFMVTLVVSLVEMVTISETGIVGFIMNVISTGAFACIASIVYKRLHTKKGAVIALLTGIVANGILMLLWNYIVTPLYYGFPRSTVIPLLPAIMAFNLLKSGLNMALTLMIYKPLATALRKSGLLPKSSSAEQNTERKQGFHPSTGVYILSAVLLVTCVLLVLALAGVI